jgi:nicotinamidase-related amidase
LGIIESLSFDMNVRTRFYQQFDADPSRDVPAENYGGWGTDDVDIDLKRTALVVMHAWDPGDPAVDQAWWRTVEYLPRAKRILEEVFPSLLSAVRSSGMQVFHVVGGSRDYYSHLPGFQGDEINPPQSKKSMPDGGFSPDSNPEYDTWNTWRDQHVFVGDHNRDCVNKSFEKLDFADLARPIGGEGVAEDGDGLARLCGQYGIQHLIYVGFAINWCLLMSPGGMIDMNRKGFVCSTIPQAVTAVENKETARLELEKQQALWRVSLEFGYVFELDSFVHALTTSATPPP